ncbi:VOC family protein [[Mycobacterium] burgundiense]|uniref:VOC family protein n=1 Tax=[Mycobacterium] burgundiense TaxID=3064286 RepID=A0ABM9LBS0_9MYCO|nr:VOC family protein [Mycolicibacterium sp. MU0053]CAJ1496280.1 VOC family protein [Mycolicibacterium sp. MU0053]
MALGVEMITFDTLDPDRLARWWAAATDGAVDEVVPGEFVMVTLASGLRLGFQHVDDPTPGKNRVHVDLSTDDDLEVQVERLVGLGAVEQGRHDFGAEFRWVVFADPDGNSFCLAAG